MLRYHILIRFYIQLILQVITHFRNRTFFQILLFKYYLININVTYAINKCSYLTIDEQNGTAKLYRKTYDYDNISEQSNYRSEITFQSLFIYIFFTMIL